ncbi:Spy/CpxP family protein refolding chaperone [Desulfovibrio gilichinskyi]|uniref:Zinc resistance-associated protein n=1 Tax=Desulfovibrio gilichinskyi TaxID=1519643 RepID=A0A1X7C9R5_9BACT|nr:periplasmic heavy metal sensor [Desulfovibrio gilichinskyi]SME92613.1 zinc resistance-associated protein [Desulfovibrio gilichinskyi]
MTKKITLFSCMMFMLLFSSAAFGQMMGSGGGMGYGGGMRSNSMWNNYQPTPEQEKTFQEITSKYQPSFAKLKDAMWAKRVQLNGILAQDKINRKQTTALAKEVGALIAQCYELQVEMQADMREKGISYYGMGMMHGGMMDMMDMMMDGGRYSPRGAQQGYGNRGMMQ